MKDNDFENWKPENLDNVPYEKILCAYREILSKLSQPKKLHFEIKEGIDTIWEEAKGHCFRTEEEGVEYFRDMFRNIAGNPFFTSGAKCPLWPVDCYWIFENWSFLEKIFASLIEVKQ